MLFFCMQQLVHVYVVGYRLCMPKNGGESMGWNKVSEWIQLHHLSGAYLHVMLSMLVRFSFA